MNSAGPLTPMKTLQTLLQRRPPVIYRWLRRRRHFPQAVMLFCLLLFLPVGFIGGAKVSQAITTNRALAATRGMAPEHSILESMSKGERAQYAAALSELVTDKPEKMYQLIGQDFLVMFREPDLKRADGPLSVWQYRTDACILDVFFKRAGDDSGAVTHYEMRPRKTAAFDGVNGQDSAVNAPQCLRSIYKRKDA